MQHILCLLNGALVAQCPLAALLVNSSISRNLYGNCPNVMRLARKPFQQTPRSHIHFSQMALGACCERVSFSQQPHAKHTKMATKLPIQSDCCLSKRHSYVMQWIFFMGETFFTLIAAGRQEVKTGAPDKRVDQKYMWARFLFIHHVKFSAKNVEKELHHTLVQWKILQSTQPFQCGLVFAIHIREYVIETKLVSTLLFEA